MNIYIGNLHANASEAQIRDLFTEFGDVHSVHIIMNTASGQSMGFGFVEIDGREGGLKAIQELDALNFMNRYLEVSEALSAGREKSYMF